MRKQKLTEYQKRYIRWFYLNEELSIVELSKRFNVSERTIGRVLKEGDVTHKDRKTNRVMSLLNKYKLTVEELDRILRQRNVQYQD